MLYIYFVHFVVLSIHFPSVLTNSDSRIFGGVNLRTDINKYLVALEIPVHLNGEFIKKTCSGSILDNHWIMSAAHCFRFEINENITVKHFVGDKFETIGHVSPSDVKLHPRYRKDASINAARHDIALLKPRIDLRQNDKIKLSTDVPKIGQTGIIAGFGETELTPKPKQGKVIIKRKGNIFCSVGKTWGGHGDSGGPLISENGLIGVISRGKCNSVKCITYYADISSNVKWIKSVLNK